jgi:hypothetical protein
MNFMLILPSPVDGFLGMAIRWPFNGHLRPISHGSCHWPTVVGVIGVKVGCILLSFQVFSSKKCAILGEASITGRVEGSALA